jgi:hypothetical protein
VLGNKFSLRPSREMLKAIIVANLPFSNFLILFSSIVIALLV